jgi:uncharacterized protein YoxC
MEITLGHVLSVVGMILFGSLSWIASKVATSVIKASHSIIEFEHRFEAVSKQMDHVSKKIDKVEESLEKINELRDDVIKHKAQLDRLWEILDKQSRNRKSVWKVQRERDHYFLNELQIAKGFIELMLEKNPEWGIKLSKQERHYPRFEEQYIFDDGLRDSRGND